jgi:hypothetical protein
VIRNPQCDWGLWQRTDRLSYLLRLGYGWSPSCSLQKHPNHCCQRGCRCQVQAPQHRSIPRMPCTYTWWLLLTSASVLLLALCFACTDDVVVFSSRTEPSSSPFPTMCNELVARRTQSSTVLLAQALCSKFYSNGATDNKTFAYHHIASEQRFLCTKHYDACCMLAIIGHWSLFLCTLLDFAACAYSLLTGQASAPLAFNSYQQVELLL